MVELVDTPDLGSGAVRYVGSSPILGKQKGGNSLLFLLRKKAKSLAFVRNRSEAPCRARTGRAYSGQTKRRQQPPFFAQKESQKFGFR